MSIGLTGAQRTGKSTLAKAFSDQMGVPFLQTSASQVFLDMGLDPKVDYPLDTRIEIQRRILESFEKQYAREPYFITDRTPVDMMAYMLGDVTRENVDAEQSRAIMGYLKDCLFVTNRFFSTLIVVQPGIKLVEAEGKAPANIAHMEHISAIVMGILVSEDIEASHYYIPRRTLDLNQRVRLVKAVVERTEERHASFVQAGYESGTLVMHYAHELCGVF